MGRASRLSPVQLADAIARERAGRPDPAAMTDEERRAAGLMDLGQAAEHEHLASLPVTRLAERVKGPAPDDIWAAPDDPGDDLAIWKAWSDAGHMDCGSWSQDAGGPVTCACGAVIPLAGAA